MKLRDSTTNIDLSKINQSSDVENHPSNNQSLCNKEKLIKEL